MGVVFVGTIGVHFGQFYLGDGTEERAPNFDCVRSSGVGIAGSEPGGAILLTGLHTGIVGVTVELAEADPGPDLDGYSDVVELDFQALAAELAIEEWGPDNVTDLGELPAGPGPYRLRYHARNVDAATAVATSFEKVVDSYLIQLWPAAPSAPRVVKTTSAWNRDFGQRSRR